MSVLDRDLTDRRKTAEVDAGELAGGSYASMLRTEAGRRLKAVPTAFYADPPTALFGERGPGGFEGWVA